MRPAEASPFNSGDKLFFFSVTASCILLLIHIMCVILMFCFMHIFTRACICMYDQYRRQERDDALKLKHFCTFGSLVSKSVGFFLIGFRMDA